MSRPTSGSDTSLREAEAFLVHKAPVKDESESENELGDLVVSVSREEAEVVRLNLKRTGHLDRRRKLRVLGSEVEIPVVSSHPDMIAMSRGDLAEYSRPPSLEEALGDSLPSELRAYLPRGWFIVGDAIVVKIHPCLAHRKGDIGEALLGIYPRCRSVLQDHGVEGQFRQPVREVIAGIASETVHRENGVRFKLDPMRIMYSPGNLRERMRMSCLGKGEQVLDMFAGIGYFSIPMAVHSRPQSVTAIELNPLAYKYLLENIRLNHVEDIVVPLKGDCAFLSPPGEADRVVMGMVGFTDRYLAPGIRALRPRGILHYHQTIPRRQFPVAMLQQVVSAANRLGREAKILSFRRIKKFSPGVVHAVADIQII